MDTTVLEILAQKAGVSHVVGIIIAAKDPEIATSFAEGFGGEISEQRAIFSLADVVHKQGVPGQARRMIIALDDCLSPTSYQRLTRKVAENPGEAEALLACSGLILLESCEETLREAVSAHQASQ